VLVLASVSVLSFVTLAFRLATIFVSILLTAVKYSFVAILLVGFAVYVL
jgi:hypothetical protein